MNPDEDEEDTLGEGEPEQRDIPVTYSQHSSKRARKPALRKVRRKAPMVLDTRSSSDESGLESVAEDTEQRNPQCKRGIHSRHGLIACAPSRDEATSPYVGVDLLLEAAEEIRALDWAHCTSAVRASDTVGQKHVALDSVSEPYINGQATVSRCAGMHVVDTSTCKRLDSDHLRVRTPARRNIVLAIEASALLGFHVGLQFQAVRNP